MSVHRAPGKILVFHITTRGWHCTDNRVIEPVLAISLLCIVCHRAVKPSRSHDIIVFEREEKKSNTIIHFAHTPFTNSIMSESFINPEFPSGCNLSISLSVRFTNGLLMTSLISATHSGEEASLLRLSLLNLFTGKCLASSSDYINR